MKRRSKILKTYLAQQNSEPYDEDYLPKQMPMDPFTKTDKRSGMTKEGFKPNWLVKYCDSPVCACAGQTEQIVAYHNDPVPNTGGSL